MAQDPVCKMDVEPARAAAMCHYGGQVYFFCSRPATEALSPRRRSSFPPRPKPPSARKRTGTPAHPGDDHARKGCHDLPAGFGVTGYVGR